MYIIICIHGYFGLFSTVKLCGKTLILYGVVLKLIKTFLLRAKQNISKKDKENMSFLFYLIAIFLIQKMYNILAFRYFFLHFKTAY